MNINLISNSPQRGSYPPLVAGAAVAVILASATGIAAMTGAFFPRPAQRLRLRRKLYRSPRKSPARRSHRRNQRREQHATHEEAPVQPRVHHYRSVPVEQAPRYANNGTYQNSVQRAPRPVAVDPNAGEVVAVNIVQESEPTTGLGAVGGAVAGGLLGNQVVGGRGRVLATIAGAAGGGLAGNGIEHAVRTATSYRVQVRMQDGSYRNFNHSTQPPVQVGERVHVSGDSLAAS